MEIIKTRDLHFSYPGDIHALKGVNLSIDYGESVAIIGRNGSGKTTLVKHMNGLLKPSMGEIRINGESIIDKEPAELAPIVGLVFQNPDDQLFSTKVWDEVAFGPRNFGLEEAEIKSRVEEALSIVELSDARDFHPYDLTLTDRKMLCLASILAMKPKAIILDEPTTAQDQLGVRRLGKIITKLLDDSITIITITHDMDFVSEIFQRTVVMRMGEIILDGPTYEVFTEKELLNSTYVKPPALVQLAEEIKADPKIMTLDDLENWLIEKISIS